MPRRARFTHWPARSWFGRSIAVVELLSPIRRSARSVASGFRRDLPIVQLVAVALPAFGMVVDVIADVVAVLLDPASSSEARTSLSV